MKNTAIKLFLFVHFIAATPSWAVETSIPIHSFVVRQERLAKNGVLVSRPVPADQIIADMLSQNQIHSLEDYSAWLDKNMTYVAMQANDQWLNPENFLKSRRGDCKDFAMLNSQVLRGLGFTPHVIALFSPENAHAICAFEYQGKFFWFDNAVLKSSKASDLVAFAEEISGKFHYTKSFELDPATKNTNLIYEQT